MLGENNVLVVIKVNSVIFFTTITLMVLHYNANLQTTLYLDMY